MFGTSMLLGLREIEIEFLRIQQLVRGLVSWLLGSLILYLYINPYMQHMMSINMI